MFKRSVSKGLSLLAIILALPVLSIPTSAQVNNCCFVDRQCNTDAEWVSGYYAFHNSQCAAPSLQSPEGSANQQPLVQGYSQQPLVQGYSQLPRRPQFSNQAQQKEAGRHGNKNRRPVLQWWDPNIWYPCGLGVPCETLTQDPNAERVSVGINLGNPNKRVKEAEDGTTIIIDPDLKG